MTIKKNVNGFSGKGKYWERKAQKISKAIDLQNVALMANLDQALVLLASIYKFLNKK